MASGMNLGRINVGRHLAAVVEDHVVERLCTDAESERQSRAHERAIRTNTGNVQPRCKVCGSFKSRPSATCPAGNCGDHPLQHNASDEEVVAYDSAHGWYEPGTVAA